MLCPKCNNEIEDNANFCNKCGYKLKGEKKPKIELSNLLIKRNIIIGGGSLLALIIIITLITILTNPFNKFKTAVNKNNVTEANKIYAEKLKGNIAKENKVKIILKEDIKNIKNDFIKNKTDYNVAILKLQTIDNLAISSSDITEAINSVNALNNSRTAFKKGNEFLNNKDYKNAITSFKDVIKEDSNYNKAQELLNNYIKDYKALILADSDAAAKKEDYEKAVTVLADGLNILPNDSDFTAKKAIYDKLNADKKAIELKNKMEEAKNNQKVIVQSASIVVQSSEYKSLYPDMIQVIIKNNSNNTIKNMNVSMLGYDANGYPLKIKTQFSFGGADYEFVGIADSINVTPGSIFGSGNGWNLDENHNIKTALACVKSVEFYDGSTWINPYYDYWLSEYKEKPLH